MLGRGGGRTVRKGADKRHRSPFCPSCQPPCSLPPAIPVVGKTGKGSLSQRDFSHQEMVIQPSEGTDADVQVPSALSPAGLLVPTLPGLPFPHASASSPCQEGCGAQRDMMLCHPGCQHFRIYKQKSS